MKTHSAVDNLCVFADSYQTFTVALILASKQYLKNVTKAIGIHTNQDEFVNDGNIKVHIMKELVYHGTQNGLEKFEIPRNIMLIDEEWSPQSGLVTASFKVKRKQIQNHYQDVIDKMYREGILI